MRKRWIAVAIAFMIMMLPVTAFAKGPETDSISSISISPSLSFDGSTAYCGLTVWANSNDSISASLKLWRGSTLLKSWNDSASGYLNMSETATVASGYTYKLTADVIVNGVAKPTVTVTKYH